MIKHAIMLTAGGTGGHLFPAFALAEELHRRGYTVDLMTDSRADKYSGGFPGRRIHTVDSATISGRGPISILKAINRIRKGIKESRGILHDVRPAAIMGFGGYPTVPPILAARKLKIPRAIHEANAVMGRANRMLAPLVQAIATSFEETKHASGAKVHVTGNPVRDAIKSWRGRPYFPPAQDRPIFLTVFGGSQGARYFSDIVPDALSRMPSELLSQITVAQQCRPEDVERVEKFYGSLGVSADIAPFFDNLPDRMASAHLIVARSGASTVSELTVIGRPAILVPLPHAIDNDQLLNAKQLTEAGGAWTFEQAGLTPEKLAGILTGLLRDPKKLETAAKVAHSMGKPEAVANLADLVEDLASQKTF